MSMMTEAVAGGSDGRTRRRGELATWRRSVHRSLTSGHDFHIFHLSFFIGVRNIPPLPESVKRIELMCNNK